MAEVVCLFRALRLLSERIPHGIKRDVTTTDQSGSPHGPYAPDSMEDGTFPTTAAWTTVQLESKDFLLLLP